MSRSPVRRSALSRAAIVPCSRWRLTHKHITRDGAPQTLLEFDATKLVQKRKAA
jgi:hypothetical protein